MLIRFRSIRSLISSHLDTDTSGTTRIFPYGELRRGRPSCEQDPPFYSLKQQIIINILKKKIVARKIFPPVNDVDRLPLISTNSSTKKICFHCTFLLKNKIFNENAGISKFICGKYIIRLILYILSYPILVSGSLYVSIHVILKNSKVTLTMRRDKQYKYLTGKQWQTQKT